MGSRVVEVDVHHQTIRAIVPRDALHHKRRILENDLCAPVEVAAGKRQVEVGQVDHPEVESVFDRVVGLYVDARDGWPRTEHREAAFTDRLIWNTGEDEKGVGSEGAQIAGGDNCELEAVRPKPAHVLDPQLRGIGQENPARFREGRSHIEKRHLESARGAGSVRDGFGDHDQVAPGLCVRGGGRNNQHQKLE
jgi:hypothetical protein